MTAGVGRRELQAKVREDFIILGPSPGLKARLALCLNSVLNVKAVVASFNQEKALVGAFSVIVQLHRLIDLRH